MALDDRETVQAKREGRGAPDGRAPDKPTDISTGATLKRTFKEFSADNITDWAAALTYYAVLAIFPAIIALVSIIGLVGDSATQPLLFGAELQRSQQIEAGEPRAAGRPFLEPRDTSKLEKKAKK